MNDAISKQQAADRAALRMDAAIQRHTGWQLEYDFTMVVKDRKRLIDELTEARARVAELETERGQLMQLIEDFTDEDDCEFDHHGGCQMHGYLSLKPGELCPHAEAKQRLAAAAPDHSDGNEQ